MFYLYLIYAPCLSISLSHTQHTQIQTHRHGADPNVETSSGLDSMMSAASYGRAENLTFFSSVVKNWNLNKKCNGFLKGWTAMHFAAAFAPQKLDTMKVFAKLGARFDLLNDRGQSVLIALCSSEDTDLNTLSFVLERCSGVNVNKQMRAQTLSALLEYVTLSLSLSFLLLHTLY